MTRGIIYYTDNRLREPIFSIVQDYIQASGLPITSVSLQPIDFGRNFVLDLTPSYQTMLRQITHALENSPEDVVFFCEHDVLYPLSHFDFIPEKDDVFYYDTHVWRWDYPNDRAIAYDRLMSLSGLCVNRLFALDHYQKRLQAILDQGWDEDPRHEPAWARRWGYEPGTKKIKRGGFSDDDFVTWQAPDPMVDIRHGKTFSPPKVHLDKFKHPPTNWHETTLDQIPKWDLKKIFNLK